MCPLLTLLNDLLANIFQFFVLLTRLLFSMTRQLLLQASSARLMLFSSVSRLHVQNISTRIHVRPKHPAYPSLNLVLYRSHSICRDSIPTLVTGTFISNTKARRSTRAILSDRTDSDENRSMTIARKFSSSSETRGVDESWPSYTADWTKHELLMCTCCGFWDYRPDGASVIVTYIDTAASVHKSKRRQMPTVLMVPSGMSDDVELKPLLELMVNSGWRIVIPDFVGMKIFTFCYWSINASRVSNTITHTFNTHV